MSAIRPPSVRWPCGCGVKEPALNVLMNAGISRQQRVKPGEHAIYLMIASVLLVGLEIGHAPLVVAADRRDQPSGLRLRACFSVLLIVSRTLHSWRRWRFRSDRW